MNNRNIADFLKSHHFIFSNPSRFTFLENKISKYDIIPADFIFKILKF